eukprot:2381690-Prymnesium_polylepis.1
MAVGVCRITSAGAARRCGRAAARVRQGGGEGAAVCVVGSCGGCGDVRRGRPPRRQASVVEARAAAAAAHARRR